MKPTTKTSSEESHPATTKPRIVLRKKHTLMERKHRKHINDRFDALLKCFQFRRKRSMK
jgi:very-short-patch-repair endonuclease